MKKILFLAMVGLVASGWLGLQPARATISAPRAFITESGSTYLSLRLLWVNPDSPYLDHINVYFSTLPLQDFGLIGAATGSQAQPNQVGEYAIAHLTENQGTTNFYYVYITAVDKSGNESSPTITLKTQTGVSPDLSGTEPVTNLTMTSISSTSLRLNWTNPIQNDLYQIAIYRSVESSVLKNDANFVARQTVLPSSTGTFTDTALSPDTTYYYRMVTEDVKANVSEPALVSGKTMLAPIVTPPVVTPPIISPTPETPPAVMPNPAKFDYRAQWISQSGTLSADKTAHVVYAHAGDTLTFQLTLKNIGRSIWLADTTDNANELKVGTWRTQDRTSQFQSNSWLSSNRVTRLSANTATGGTTTLTWTMTVPTNTQPATYREYFRLVAEYCKWFGPTGIFWDIVVS